MTDHELFREVTVRLFHSLDLATAVQKAFGVLAQVLPLDEIRVNILDRDLHAVKTIAVVDSEGAQNLLARPVVLPLPASVESELAGRALDDVRIVRRFDEDRATAAIRDEYFADVPESSMLIMRLILEGRRQGALILRAEGEDRYAEEHKRVIRTLNEPFAIALNNAVTHHQLEQLKDSLAEENRYLSRELREGSREIVGASFGLAGVMGLIRDVAALDSPVLLFGETGVGKELVADAIHRSSSRRDGPFIKMNCGAIAETLVDSELFGHERGAFTGAVSRKKGRFERAHRGTLFLDEVGELPLEAQVRLLRVLQTKMFERVGGATPIEADVRIIAATHRDLPHLVEENRFRRDLFYRINVFPIEIPPLRERRMDIPALVHHFVEKKSREMGLDRPPPLAEGAMDRLRAYSWPGNVRELENAVERALILFKGGALRFDGLTEAVAPPETAGVPRSERTEGDRPAELDEVVSRHIRRALRYTGGKVGGPDGAAGVLGVNPSTLRNRMKKLGIRYGRS